MRAQLWLTWQRAYADADRHEHPRPDDCLIGDRFVDSLTTVDDRVLPKLWRALVAVLTERAAELPSLEPHKLRRGAAGDSGVETRADGAVCWRYYIEHKTPRARRVHVWALPGARREIARVVLHDDFEP